MNMHFLLCWRFTKKEADTFIASPLQTLKDSEAVIIKPTKQKYPINKRRQQEGWPDHTSLYGFKQ